MIFVDTNYFLRFLLKDIEGQYQQTKDLFLRGAEGEVRLFTSLIVIFEIYWVLTSFYKKKKEKVIKILEKVFGLEFIGIENKELLRGALKIYQEAGLELEDCYNLALIRKMGIEKLRTFDKKLSRQFRKNN